MITRGVARRFAIVIGVGMFALVSTQAQSEYHFRSREIRLAENSMTLLLNDLPEGSDWVVGMSPGSVPRLVVADVYGKPAQHGRPFAPAGFEEWPDESVRSSAGNVTLDHLSRLKGKLLVFLEVPPGTQVEVKVDGKSVAQVAAEQGFLIRQGRLISTPVSSIARVFTELMSPGGLGPPSFSRQADGTYLVTNAILRDHLLTFVRPKLSVPGNVQSGTAILRLSIDVEGRIVSRVPLQGDSVLTEACLDALQSWRFRPLHWNGKPVPVSATLVFKLSKEGQVLSSLVD